MRYLNDMSLNYTVTSVIPFAPLPQDGNERAANDSPKGAPGMSHHLGSGASPQQPTPYPAVNAVVHELLTSIQAILGAQLRGMYLLGSLALGDFHPQESDLDLVIVTAGTLSDEIFASLRELHRRFDHSASAWAARLDAVYIPQDVLRESFPTAARYPILEWPGLLVLEPLESGWPIQRYTFREYGVVLSGPDPRSLLDPVNPDDLRQASAAIVERWREQAHRDQEWVAWLREPDNHTFVVLTLCRLLYTLETGSVASKPAAARWVERTLPSRWSGLIGRATTGQHATDDEPEDAVNNTLALLEYTYEHYQQWQASSTNRQA
ncbi:MAG: aminoglycoside adenylyltransferase domain-containing protein [Ktedonobacterales bacterium]